MFSARLCKWSRALFLAIISIISVNTIAPLITCFEIGFNMHVWADTLKVMPLIWISVIILVLLTRKPASWMKSKIIAKEDSFNAYIIVETLCTAFLMSIFLTVIGTWIGTGKISMELIYTLLYKWPRNFAIAFAVEIIIAQPIARMVIVKIHKANDSKNCEMEVAN